MMRFIVVSILLFNFGCSTFATDLSPSQSSTALAFDSTNQKILADAQFAYKNDLGLFTLQDYKDFLDKYTSKQPMKLREALEDFDVQKFQTYRETFLFCVFSSNQRFAMCDDPQCVGVEEKEVGVNKEILETWKNKFPLDRCPER